MNSVKALPLYLNISLLCYPSVNKWKISNTTIDLVYCDYFTHELRIPYFVFYESPPDRGSMVENWYLRVNEPLGLWREVFRLTTTLSFEALQRPTKFLKTFTDAFFLTTILALCKTFVLCLSRQADTQTLRHFLRLQKGTTCRYPFLLLLDSSATACADYCLRIWFLKEAALIWWMRVVASLHLQRKHLNKSFRIR